MHRARLAAVLIAWISTWCIAGALLGAFGAFLGTLDRPTFAMVIFLSFWLASLIMTHLFDNLTLGIALGGVPLAGNLFMVAILFPGATDSAVACNTFFFAIGAAIGTLSSIQLK